MLAVIMPVLVVYTLKPFGYLLFDVLLILISFHLVFSHSPLVMLAHEVQIDPPLPPRDSKGGEGLLRAVGERKTLYLGFDRPRPCHGGKVIDSWLNQIIAMLLQKGCV